MTPLRIVLLLLVLAAQMGFAAAVSLADGGDFSLDFVAAKPGTYDQSTGTGGVYGTGGNDTTVESLEGGDFACGDIVEFFTAVTVDSGATGTQSIDINYDFSAVTTSGGAVGFGDIVYVALNPNDPGNLNLDGNETVTLTSETHTATDTLGTVTVTGLDAGDQVIVALGVEITCEVSPGTVTGNIQTAILSAETSEGDAIPVGQQTVPLKSAGAIAAPGVDITKTCTPTVHVGDDITYTITITNTGNETLNIDSVVDSVLGDITNSFPATLGAGLSDTETFTHTTELGDGTSLTNTVTVNATGDISGSATTDNASCTTTIEFTSSLEVLKSCTPEVPVGGTVTYTITITNTGDDVLNGITVDDTLLGPLSDSFADSLDPGASESHEFTRDQQPGDPDPIENIVTVEADGAFSGTHLTETANCLTDVTHVPGVAVAKTCPKSAAVGDTITYAITVTNTGNEPLTDITVVDSVVGDISDLFSDTLEVGASETVEVTHDVTASDPNPLENSVTVTATGSDSQLTVHADTACSTAIPPVIALTGANTGRGILVLLMLLLGGAMFLVVGWERRNRARAGGASTPGE